MSRNPADDVDRRRFAEYFTARWDTVRRMAYVLCGDWYWAEELCAL